MRHSLVSLVIVGCLIPQVASAQSRGKFDLECSEQISDGYNRQLTSRTRYSVDLDRNLGCQQSSSMVRNNLCAEAKPVAFESPEVISFVAEGHPVRINLRTGSIEGATTITRSRGTCTRATFTDFPS